jgi:uncharacterized protein
MAHTMSNDFEIGRIVAVDTAQVTIELNKDLRALTRTTYEGVQDVGRINSYVVMPVGAHRLVAMVTRVLITEEAEVKADRTMISLPSARRLMKATLIGTIDGRSFTQGVSLFPVLDNQVLLPTKNDLDIIFEQTKSDKINVDDPGYCIKIGESTLFKGRPINVDPDAFFGKHAAVLGSTGSGKSCTIASIIQSILNRDDIRQTNFVILDTNGEYRTAFQKIIKKSEPEGDDKGTRESISKYKCSYIPSDPKKPEDRLVIPYWFLNADDFVRLFRASQGVQRPVLLEALRISRNEEIERTKSQILREELIHELNRIWSLSGKDEKVSKDIRDLANGLLTRIEASDFGAAWDKMPSEAKEDKVKAAIQSVKIEAEKHIDSNIYPKVIPADGRAIIRKEIEPIYTALTGNTIGGLPGDTGVSADTPAYFDKLRFRNRHIEQVLRREESGGTRARDFSGTMLLRIDRLLADSRFDFLFGKVNGNLPKPKHGLASFIRDLIGLLSVEEPMTKLSNYEEVPKQSLPFYDRQRALSKGHNIVIIDLSLLASEVLDNVTALIGRIILEFLQRFGEEGGEESRGSLPLILVLEEAQNYIRQSQKGEEDESISRVVFERIAREGRKYGLGLVVASQRPSELSKTVLSQCSSFIVHRLQNPEDLRYFKDIVPSVYSGLMDQLPALAPQTALVLGECVRAPALLRIRDAQPLPRSRDPKFYKYWISEDKIEIPVEEICLRWEGQENERNEGDIETDGNQDQEIDNSATEDN